MYLEFACGVPFCPSQQYDWSATVGDELDFWNLIAELEMNLFIFLCSTLLPIDNRRWFHLEGTNGSQ